MHRLPRNEPPHIRGERRRVHSALTVHRKLQRRNGQVCGRKTDDEKEEAQAKELGPENAGPSVDREKGGPHFPRSIVRRAEDGRVDEDGELAHGQNVETEVPRIPYRFGQLGLSLRRRIEAHLHKLPSLDVGEQRLHKE